jgi:hypothetical protein
MNENTTNLSEKLIEGPYTVSWRNPDKEEVKRMNEEWHRKNREYLPIAAKYLRKKDRS